MSLFPERQNYFKEKTTACFAPLLGASYMQKTSEFDFSSLPLPWFCLMFVGIALNDKKQLKKINTRKLLTDLIKQANSTEREFFIVLMCPA